MLHLYIKSTEKDQMEERVKRLQNKDPEAFRQLYDQFARPMYNLCLRMTGHPDDAHDVLQDSFMRIFEKIGQLRQAEMLPAWIKRSASTPRYSL
ncbi:MAG: hypothetical protein IPM34_13695 [Saprospiraceae bacterium]|nr:hypothetical protein [Saprospiraceae bacterium]